MIKLKKKGVHGIIESRTGMFLIVKRSESDVYDAGSWDLPGGGLEGTETIEAGFVREALEETGLEVCEVQVTHAYALDDGSLQLAAKAKTVNDLVKLGPEHSEFKWVDWDELRTIKPASLHLKAVQYMLKNSEFVAKYEDYK
jgi:8-oxo-dGTP diphosphatase